jgi:hypothetical protein
LLKRAKGKRGLDYTARLQRTPRLDVMVDETPVPGIGVDQMLVELARTMPAIIVTTDGALSQVAKINGITVLNLNDLANALKSAFVPGESIRVQLIRQGEQPSQAVGYLPDGAMVVAEDGAVAIGQDVELIVTSTLQTSAGRLIFAKLGPGNSLKSQSPDGVQPLPDEGSPPATESASTPDVQTSPQQIADAPIVVTAPTRGPMPPAKVFRPTRSGTPRNPRR